MKIVNNIKTWDESDWVGFSVFAALASCVGVLIYALFMSVNASGLIDACHVEYYTGAVKVPSTYIVVGHVPWRHDVVLAVAETSEEAAQKLKETCPVK